MKWSNPNTLPSHHNTPMTTITFKIDLMELAIGMKLIDQPQDYANDDQGEQYLN